MWRARPSRWSATSPLEIRSGTLQIVKTSEDGEVSGIPFHISGNGVERDVVTGPDGTIGVDNLQAGTYTITERSPDRYVQPASQQVTIYPGQTSSVSFSNVLKKFTVTMEKVDSVTGEAQGDASWMVRCTECSKVKPCWTPTPLRAGENSPPRSTPAARITPFVRSRPARG